MTLVDTRYGKVEGIERRAVLQFRGIPFAAPPVGELRLRPPQPPIPWTAVWAADQFRPGAPQDVNRPSLIPGAPKIETDEDCLYLNVYTPGTGGPPRPVMVWIHGGGFTAGSGSNPWYNGESFAHNGVVTVTLNYRLGALGFLDLGSDPDGSANCGLLDQIAALEWVRDNIAAFGGDPGNVILFGESAGAMSVGALLAAPAAAGFFQTAIAQSGAASNVHSRERAADIAERMKAKLGGLDELLSAPAAHIVAAQSEVVAEAPQGLVAGLAFQPSVDGMVLPQPPLDAIQAGSAASVRLMAGTNRDEMTLFLAASPAYAEATAESVIQRLDRIAPGTGPSLYDAYQAALGGSAAPPDVWVAIETDRVFRIPAVCMAQAQLRNTSEVWMYLFTWESPAMEGAFRSCHALEIPFVCNTLSDRGAVFTGSGPAADQVAQSMHGAWGALAMSGDPGWDRYDTERRATRIFGPDAGVVFDPMGETRRLWDA